MASLFATGRVADLIAGLMLLEMVSLTILHRRTGRGVPPPELAASLTAGVALVLALRAGLVGSPWHFVATWLAISFVAHVLYLTLRWNSNTFP